MGRIQEIINGKQKKKGFAILGESKLQRKQKIVNFVKKYGRGDKGLTEAQEKARIEKFIGHKDELEKLKGFGTQTTKGVKLHKNLDFSIQIPDNHEGPVDRIPKEIIQNLHKYPKDLRSTTHDARIVAIDIKDNGEMEIHAIIKDGNEHDVRTRQFYSVLVFDDLTSAINEAKQYKEGKLQEVSDRTMAIHEDEGVLDLFLEADHIDTNEDKNLQF